MQSPLPASPIPKQNLIRQIRPFPILQKGVFYKVAALHVLTVASAFAFGYFYHQFLEGASRIWYLIGAATIFGVLSVFETYLVPRLRYRIYVIVAETIALLSFFATRDLWTVSLIALIIFTFLTWGELGSRHEIRNSISLRFFRVARRQLSKVITALIIMAVILYIPVLETRETIVAKKNFDLFFDRLRVMMQNVFPYLDFSSSVEVLARSIVEEQTRNEPAFALLPPADQERFIEAQTTQTVREFERRAGISLGAGQSIKEASYVALSALLTRWRTQFDPWFVTAWAIGIFLLIEGTGVLFYWLVAIVAFIFFELLLAMGMVRIVGETQTKELAEFS